MGATQEVVESDLQLAQTIRRVKVLLLEDGWTRMDMGKPGTRHCVLGGFKVVEGIEGDEHAVFAQSRAAQRFARCLGFTTASSLYLWNDAVGRTQEKVVDALEDCAREVEGR